jgi:Ca2+:H+ antiporter
MCFFAGGTRFSEQGFSVGAAQINGSLLILSVVGMLLPAVLWYAINGATDVPSAGSIAKTNEDVLKLSHGIALLLLLGKRSPNVLQLSAHSHSLRLLYRLSAEVID